MLHTQRGGWHFTALFSNTARAHDLGREHDGVVVYAVDADHAERQYTVVSARTGVLAGLRVARGREAECGLWYAGAPDPCTVPMGSGLQARSPSGPRS